MASHFDLCRIPVAISPDGSISDFRNVETLAPVLISVCVVLAALVVITTGCRLFANRHKPWWSDYFVAVALILSLAHTGLVLAQTRYARHQWDVRACWYGGSYMKLLFAQHIILSFAPFFSKSSIFLLYQQIFGVQNSMRISVRCGIIFTALLYFTNVPVAAALSAPHAGETWSSLLTNGRPQRHLIWAITQAALGVLLDLVIFMLPIPSILRLNLSHKRRVQLLVIFCTALVGVAAGLLSLVYRVQALDTQDGSWNYTAIIICTVVENDVAIIISSTPGFANFMRVYMPQLGVFKSISSMFSIRSEPKYHGRLPDSEEGQGELQSPGESYDLAPSAHATNTNDTQTSPNSRGFQYASSPQIHNHKRGRILDYDDPSLAGYMS
ncbi:hypothetical protein B0I35DRAFT_424077 [Stachybotrys elegans]|uniref:Rhodopsin domain-containing protein n=1 Tax=Stachybotrys elegans TaxID=80388 RepID=A0A8K0SX45_9HYPO|nr:hypothetical protein B0I35DRAFT_424077 [Stachybotrys elegans]